VATLFEELLWFNTLFSLKPDCDYLLINLSAYVNSQGIRIQGRP
jgi:hypothetical protein